MEFITGSPETTNTLQKLWASSPVKGAYYNDIILSSTEPGTFDEYDLSITSLARYAVLYWPGGAPRTGNNLEALVLQETLAPAESEAAWDKIRRTLVGASISSAAVGRVPEDVRAAWRATENIVPPPIEQLTSACKRVQLPLAVCAISDVTCGEDQQIVHMWYPSTIHPQPILETLQGVVAESA